jgi:hypothetical protein
MRFPVSSISTPRPHRIGILFLVLTLAVLALEAWGIGVGLSSLR